MRAAEIFAAIRAAFDLPFGERQLALSTIPSYRSRGHGRNKYGGKKRGNRTGKTYSPNGAREVERRQRQINNGVLRTS